MWLKPGEEIVSDAKISKAAIILLWVSVPAFLLVFCVIVYLPQIIAIQVNAELRRTIMEAMGVEYLSFGNLLSAAKDQAFSSVFADLAGVVSGIVTFFVILLIIVWFIWACIYTRMNVRYSLTLTNQRVIATVKGESFEAEYKDIYNVCVLRSIWGKLFGFGEISVQAEKGAMTVKNIASAEQLQKAILDRVDEAQGKN